MVLYYTVSTYHILRSILHKLNYHHDEEAVLLVPAFFPKMPLGVKKNDSAIFKKIIFYDWERKRYEEYPQGVFSEIKNALNEKIGEKWENKISEFNIFKADRFFGAYLVDNEIAFNWFEEADGRYLNPWPPMEDDKRLYFERFNLANSLGLYTAENNFIQNIYISLSANEGAELNEKIINFEVNDELKKLSNIDTKKILEFWGVKQIKENIGKHSALLMSQHFCNVKTISFEEQVLLYQMTVDYFLMNYNIYLKMHPSDLFPYKEFIDGVISLDMDYPSELLQYSCTGKFEVAAAVSSTGVKNLRNISCRQMLLNEDYLISFKDNDLYYFACMMIKTFTDYDPLAYGVNERQLRVMLEYGFNITSKIDFNLEFVNGVIRNKIIIIGSNYKDNLQDKIAKELCEDNIIVLLKCKGSLEELEFLKSNTIVVKRIKTYSIRTGEEKELVEKVVFIASKNKEILERVNSMEYEKLLSNTKVKLRVDSNINKDIQISTLIGMLDETELALKNCVEENHKLRTILQSHNVNLDNL